MSELNKIESTNEQSGKTREEKIKNAISASLIVTGAASAGYLIHDSLNEGRISKWLDDIQPKSDVLSEDPTLLDGVVIEDDKPSVQSTVSFEDDLDAVSADITNEELEEVEREGIVGEIMKMVENVNSQSLEEREKTDLTTDLGLLEQINEQYPELRLPMMGGLYREEMQEYWDRDDIRIEYIISESKDYIPFFSYNSLINNFSQYPNKVEEGTVLLRHTYALASERTPWPNNTFAGDIKFEDYKPGDIVMILGEGAPNPLEAERLYVKSSESLFSAHKYAVYDGLKELGLEYDLPYLGMEGRDQEEEIFYGWHIEDGVFHGWHKDSTARDLIQNKVVRNNNEFSTALDLGFILDKKVNEDGQEILIMVKANNETREIEVHEITSENLEEILGKHRFSMRRKLFGEESMRRVMELPFLSPSSYELLNREFTTEDRWEEPPLWQAGPEGTTLHSFDIYNDGYLIRDGKQRRVVVPPGFLFKIQEIYTMKHRNTGDILEVGLLGDIRDGYANSIVIMSVTDSEGNKTSFLNEMSDDERSALDYSEYLKMAALVDGYKDTRQHRTRIRRIPNRLQETGWDNSNEIPFYVYVYEGNMTSHGGRVFEDYFRRNERFSNCLTEGTCIPDDVKEIMWAITETDVIRNMRHLVYKINLLAEYPSDRLWSDWLTQTNWFVEHLHFRAGESGEIWENRNTALRYLDHGKVEGQPLQGIPFQVALSLLYPELNIQSVGGATVIGEDGEERGAITADELIPEELKDNPNLKSAQTGYGGTMHRFFRWGSSQSLFDFIETGDTIISGEGIRIIVGKFEDEEGYPIILFAEANRYSDGFAFLAEISKNARGSDYNQNMWVGAQDLVGFHNEIFILRSNNQPEN